MGTTITKSGVSVQFCDAHGNDDGDPVFSRFVRVLGLPREEAIKRTGGGKTKEEADHPGSEDWLTLIAVADSKDKLTALVKDSGLEETEAQTSGSSRRVQVRLHIGALKTTVKGRITIASGPVVQLSPPIMHVLHIKVLGEKAAMNPKHPLFEEFKAQGPFVPPLAPKPSRKR